MDTVTGMLRSELMGPVVMTSSSARLDVAGVTEVVIFDAVQATTASGKLVDPDASVVPVGYGSGDE
jgi:hypothetical protein